MFPIRALFLLVSISVACEIFPTSRFVLREQIHGPPPGFVYNGPADPSAIMSVRLGLKSKNRQGLEDALLDVSSPNCSSYGQHLTAEEVDSFTAPSRKTMSTVSLWLESNGIEATNASSSGDWIRIQVNASQANRLFNAQYNTYTHQSSGRQTIRTLSYSLPEDVVEHIETIHPTTGFPSPPQSLDSFVVSGFKYSANTRRSLSNTSEQASLDCTPGQTDPPCIQSLYGFPTTFNSQNASRIVVGGFHNQFAQEEDLRFFLRALRPDVNPINTTFSLQTLDGGKNPQDLTIAGGIADTNIEYTVGLADGVPVQFISVGEDNHDGLLLGALDFLNAIAAEKNPPQVLLFSYSLPGLPKSLMYKFCNAAMALGARGVSIIVPSGNGGVSGADASDTCTTFVTSFPNDCPYVTSVGVTTDLSPEIGFSLSGGGFSEVFSTPSYQQTAVRAYLNQLGNKNAGLFNRNGRAYPDVSMHGTDIILAIGGVLLVTDAACSECSASMFASLIGQINALRLQANKKALGFLNPTIYSHSEMFTDITSGNNEGCNTTGFPATKGWDPVTGMGTPLFEAFQQLP